jgi:replicative DNA helicase
LKRETLEVLVVGLIMKSEDNMEKALDNNLNNSDIHNNYLSKYFDIIQNKCFSEGIKPTTTFIYSELDVDNEKEEKKHKKYLKKLKNIEEPAENFDTYLEKLKERNLQLEILSTINTGKNEIKEDKDSGNVLSGLLYNLMSLEGEHDNQSQKFKLNAGLKNHLKELKESDGAVIIPTGYVELDKYINGGFRLSTLNYLIGRPSNGKSTMALNIAANAAIDYNTPTCFVSLEMPMDQVIKRLFALLSIKLSGIKPVPLYKLKNKKYMNEEDWEALDKVIEATEDIPLYIEDKSVCTIAQYYALVNKYKRIHNVNAFYLDYYQLLRLPNGQKAEKESEYAALSEGLRTLARKTKTAQVALAQVSRKPENRPLDKRAPRTSDMRNSGKADQDAETVLGAFREEHYTGEESERPNEIDIYVRKNRDGNVGKTTLFFNGDYVSIEDIIDTGGKALEPEVHSKDDSSVKEKQEEVKQLRDKFKTDSSGQNSGKIEEVELDQSKFEEEIKNAKNQKETEENNTDNSEELLFDDNAFKEMVG